MKRRICLAWFGDAEGSLPGARVKSQTQNTAEPSREGFGSRQGAPKEKERSSELRRWIRKG